MTNRITPQPSATSLLISSEHRVEVSDAKLALRSELTRYYGPVTALMMIQSLNFNLYYERDGKHRAILVSADTSTVAATVIIDLYVRLSHYDNEVLINSQTCYVSLHGTIDPARLDALSKHYYWMDFVFGRRHGPNGERHLLN